MRKLLTVDEFRASARDEDEPSGTVVRLAVADPLAATDGSRKVRFVFSDGTVDRAGDSIDPKGWQTESFLKNPVALWAHDSSAPPIGRASNVGAAGNQLMGDIEFMPADISPFADSVYRMVKGGFVKAVSVGFMPLEWAFSKDKARPFGIDFTKQELLEISVCPVPCNPNALQEAKSQGIDTGPIRQWAEKLLDEGRHVLVPRDLLEETFRQAKTPHIIRQSYLSAKATPEWKVGAALDLPIDGADTWDITAAAKRMLDAAGFDGENPDPVKAARGFLIHDAANPTLRASYKRPFADIIDGELKAVKAGVAAARANVNRTAAPADVLDGAESVLDAYEKRIGEGNLAAPEEKTVVAEKSGRRISSANEALLQKAMEHHASATECIKAVLDSNTSADDPDGDGDVDTGNPEVPQVIVLTSEDDKRKARLEEARALKASLKH